MKNYKRIPENNKSIEETESVLKTYLRRTNMLKVLQKKLKVMKTSDPDYTKLYNHIEKLKNNLNKMRLRILAVVLVEAVAIGSVAGGAVAIENNNFEKDLNSGTQTVENINGINDYDGSYKEFKDKILRYSKLLDLKKEDKLTETDKKEIEYLKSYIRSHPEEINDLALEIVKTKIAQNIDIDDPSLISTRFYTNTVSEGGRLGTRTEMDISIKTGEHSSRPIATYNDFTSANDPNRGFKSNEISEELYEALACISANQSVGSDLKFHNAKRALALALGLNPEKILDVDITQFKGTVIEAGGKEFVIFE